MPLLHHPPPEEVPVTEPTVPEEEERLTAPLRVNLLPTEYAQLQTIAASEDRPIASVARRAIRDMLNRHSETAELRVALAAYRSALRSGEGETPGLRAIGDAALGTLAEVV